ncbi:MAG: methyltransferase domain-containing protein [Acidobacteriia bacterium]|nr:methyltransferase domain-containing protein [Terriglobia bacterium]
MKKVIPSLEGLEQVIEILAADPRSGPNSADWVRRNIGAAGEKVRILRYVSEKASSGGPPTRLLDIGAQIGSLAIYAAKLGFHAAAVDYGFFAGVYGKIAADHGVDYRECDVGSQQLPFADSSFDFVTYTDVIEHHAFSPKRVLREIHRVLAPGGRVIITTPNHASIYNRILLLFGKSVNDRWDYYFEGSANQAIYLGHHHEYTRGELRAALEATDFRVRDCRVVEEDLASLLYYLRRQRSAAQWYKYRRQLLVRILGTVWTPLHLPFGRGLWAVGQKSAGEATSLS